MKMKMMRMLMMAKNRIGVSYLGISGARSHCTVAVTAGEYKPSLYRRLATVGSRRNSKASIEGTLNGWLKEGNVVTQSELLRIVKELRRYKSYNSALELTDWMEKKGIELSISYHAVRLDLISKVKGLDAAERYFFTLPEIAKNHQTYGALFNTYCQKENADKAIALFDKLKALNFASGCLVYNSIMTLHMKLGQPDKVPLYFQQMKAANITPDKVSYGLLISCYAAKDDANSVERVVKEIKEEGKVALGWDLCCHLASFYNSAGLYEKSASMLKKAEENTDPNDRHPYEFIVSLYAGAGNLAEVKRMWKLQRSAFPKLTNKSYLNMMTALRKLGDDDGIEQCFHEWESEHVNYDVRLVNIMIECCLRNGKVEKADSLLKEALQKGITDFKTVNTYANYYMERRELDMAVKFLKLLSLSAIPHWWKLDKEKMNDFLKYLEEIKDVDMAEEVYKILKKLDCVDRKVYDFLLRTYLAAGKKDGSLYQRIKEDGVEITSEIEELLERFSIAN